MKFIFIALIVLTTTINALTFKVATYNVKNFFDLKYQGNEYKEFKPNTRKWNKKRFNKKLKNIIKVLKTKNFDIISLQEIESKEALSYILKKLPQYKYSYFYKKQTSAIGLSIISKYPIISNKIITVQKFNKRSRDILKSKILIDGKELIIFSNHWNSKRAGENKRVPYAMALMKHIYTLNHNSEYIILGDLNSNYNEYKTFKYNKKLNTTSGITGINQILNTTINKKFITKNSMSDYKYHSIHYNLWLDKKREKRYSYIFRNQKETPDNIILPKTLFDNKSISYVNNSFNVLYSKNKQSDHLLIYASFDTNKVKHKTIKDKKKNRNNIDLLYNIEHLEKPMRFKNLTVIYEIDSKNIIVKQENTRAIYLYKIANKFKLNHTYNLTINKIERFNGLLEVMDISNIKEVSKNNVKVKDQFIDGTKIDIFNPKYQNEIVKNLTGIYKKRYLHFLQDGIKMKIRLYSKNKNILPKENEKITINSGHISIYKSTIQVVLYKKSDYIYSLY
jgi:endonuclease/exonuclease/phosphatase family metal-dependent hydrolase